MSLRELRQEAIFKALSAGKNPTEAIKMADNAAREFRDERGQDTFDRFISNSWRFFAWILEDIRKANGHEDHQRGIDCFLYFNDNPRLDNLANSILPVQIKSSNDHVDMFRNDPRYVAIGKRIMVINSSFTVSKNNFKESFFKEIHRINHLLTNS
jgi:hypothetical protein